MKSILLAVVIVSVCCAGCEKNPADDAGQIAEETTTIRREVATPSGDWAGEIEYTYGRDGKLRHASYEFRTFTGHEHGSQEFEPTRCEREYKVSEDGKLVLTSKVTTDLATGESVERGFYDPEITHWMTITEARKEIQAERGGAGKAPARAESE